MHNTLIFLKINTLKSSEVQRASTVSTGVRVVKQGSALTLRVWGGREDRGSDQAADRHSRLFSGTSSFSHCVPTGNWAGLHPSCHHRILSCAILRSLGQDPMEAEAVNLNKVCSWN